ncbi:O-antigen ligase like membrane protein [Xylanibacter ruminicola]|uniref:O-antigen ligase like membrane protein n=1 Tax=Xylanibacter ruminicola TaxID=839 RepID=A0A1M7JHR4_XYLRU|nr:O-antigen ligase family protein [Xylanibacter ruminicola]SFC68613.1 O-antigen ligase like membrane protein [Xylanibacter ruminicola]SHM52544.1 O-antigen ligase like membrane protein [Xylanibacter ruminicola]
MKGTKVFANNKGFFFVVLLIYLFWSIVPQVHDMVDRMLMLVTVLTLLPMILGSGVLTAYASQREKKLLLFITLFVVWQLMMKLVGHSNSAWGTHSEVLLFYFYFLIYLYIRYKFTLSEKKILLKAVFGIVSLSMLYYIYMGSTGQLLITYNPELYEMDMEVVPTIYKCELLFLACTCITCMFAYPKLGEKIFFLLMISAAVYIIYVIGNNATATILLLLFLFIAFLVYRKKKKYSVKPANIGTLIIVISVVAVLMVILGDSLILLLANLTEEINPRISNKLMTVYVFTQGSHALVIEEGNSFVTRLFLMKGSMMTWLDNPINLLLGVGRDNGFFEESGIGKHSEFMDVLAMYGIIGATFTIAIFSNMYSVIRAKLKPLMASYFTFFYFIMILWGFLNNLVYPQLGAILFCFSFVYLDVISAEKTLK